jgi:hypothetical protein
MAWTLAPDIFLAEVCGDIVLLDGRRNLYWCVARTGAAPLRNLLHGKAAGRSAIIDDLEAEGLISWSDTPPATLPVCTHSAPAAEYRDIGVDALAITPRTLLHLALASMEVALKLARPQPRKWLRPSIGDGDPALLTRACTLAVQFERLRPLIPCAGSCLPSSMLLRAFLRRHGIGCRWIFGVQTFPFEAHCWVEYQGVVLNDTVEHVSWYTPIATA